jgi:hypothetical protein
MSESNVKENEIEQPATDGETSVEPNDLFAEGLALFERGAVDDAKICFQSVHNMDAGHARARSYLGVCVAVSERRFEEGVALCTSASKQEFFNPDSYLNLARVHLDFGFKGEGRRFLLRGQMIDPANEAIKSELQKLGERVPPVLRFLPRRHLINRLLGTAKHALSPMARTQAAA